MGKQGPCLVSCYSQLLQGGFNDKGEALAITLKTDHPDATFNDDVALMRARTALGGGKTKLAMEILDDSLKRWPDGIWQMNHAGCWRGLLIGARNSRWRFRL